MVPQEGGHGALIAEFRYLPLADAALRTDDEQDFPGSGACFPLPCFKDGAQRPNGVLMQDDSEVGSFHGSGKPGSVDGGPHFGDPGAPRLLGGRGHGGFPFGMGPGCAVALPADD